MFGKDRHRHNVIAHVNTYNRISHLTPSGGGGGGGEGLNPLSHNMYDIIA